MKRESAFEGARPDALGRFSDAAHRIADTINQAIADGHAGKWMAHRLDTGHTDGVVYDRRRAAVSAQGSDADRRVYTKIPYDVMPVKEAASWLEYNRMVLEKLGGRLPDPETDQVVMPRRVEMLPQRVRQARAGLWIPGMN